MSINFGLLGLGPIDRSLTPQNAPGPQAFDALFKGQQLQEQKRSNVAQETLQQSQLEETKRSNLEAEALASSQFEFESKDKFNESIRQFGVLTGLKERGLDLQESQFDRKQDFLEDMTQKQFLEDIRQFDVNTQLALEGLDLDQQKVEIQDRLAKIQETRLGFDMQDREQVQQVKQLLGQAAQEGGLPAVYQTQLQLGMINEALNTRTNMVQIQQALVNTDLAIREYEGTNAQRKVASAMKLANDVVALKGSVTPEEYQRIIFKAGHEINSALGGKRNITSPAEMESLVADTALGFGQMMNSEVQHISQGAVNRGQAALVEDVFGGPIARGTQAALDSIRRDAIEGDTDGSPKYLAQQFGKSDGSLASALASKPDPKAFEITKKLRDEFNERTKEFQSVNSATQRVLDSAKSPSAAGDLALIFNYMKVLDPGSTVREGEFATAQNSSGIPERLRARYNSIVNGERLSDKQRNDFVSRAMKLRDGQLKNIQPTIEQLSRQADKNKIPVEDVISEFKLSNVPLSALDREQRNALIAEAIERKKSKQ